MAPLAAMNVSLTLASHSMSPLVEVTTTKVPSHEDLPYPWNLSPMEAKDIWIEDHRDRNDHSEDQDRYGPRSEKYSRLCSFAIMGVLMIAIFGLVIAHLVFEAKEKRLTYSKLMRRQRALMRHMLRLAKITSEVGTSNEAISNMAQMKMPNTAELDALIEQGARQSLEGSTLSKQQELSDFTKVGDESRQQVNGALAFSLIMQGGVGSGLAGGTSEVENNVNYKCMQDALRLSSQLAYRSKRFELVSFLNRFYM